MEVHHHAHHERKNWKSYIWEFLMLFLAVFCGFLAEYQLEHKIEKDRAKELAKSFYQELKNDSVTAEIKLKNRIKNEKALIYLINFFKDSSLTNLSKEFSLQFVYGIAFRSPSFFEPRTIILDQLKNSGSLRYFKNDSLQILAGNLSVAIKNLLERNQLEDISRRDNIYEFHRDYYDIDFDQKIRKGGKHLIDAIADYESSNFVIPFVLKNNHNIDRDEIVRKLYYHWSNGVTSTRQLQLKNYKEVNAQLLKALRKEFKIKD